MLEIKNLSKTYRPKKGTPVKALDNVSISFEEKGLVFILGKSGCGKSTLLNLLGGLDRFDSGEIIIKGKSSADFSGKDFDSYRNTFIGFIFQEYNILEEFTVGANIALAMELQGKKADSDSLNKILEEVDLTGYANRKPNELSGGQKQRVAIARALIKSPEIIMADEPTGALDSNTGRAVFDTLKKLSREKLVIVVSHDREFAELYGDRVIELSDGRIISDIKKHVEISDKDSRGISVIEDKVIRIKKGYTLTPEDLSMINEYLKKNRDSDSFISIDEKTNDEIKKFKRIDGDGNQEVFAPTEKVGLDIKSYDGSKLKMIRSRLPLRNSLKIALSSLKTKPFKLAVTILLSSVAFILFAISNTLSSYDKVNTTLRSMSDNGINYLSMGGETKISDDYYSYYRDILMNGEQFAELENKYPQIHFLRVYRTNSEYYGLSSNLAVPAGETENSPYYTADFSGMAAMDPQTMEENGFTLLGSLPKENNEIAITKYTSELLIKTGLIDENGEKTEISNESDLIGKTLSFPINFKEKSFVISGIIDTNFNTERYEILKTDFEKTSPEKELLYMNLQNEMSSVVSSSYHALAYVTENVIDTAKQERGIATSGSDYNISFSIASQEEDERLYLDYIPSIYNADLNKKTIIGPSGDTAAVGSGEAAISLGALKDTTVSYKNSLYKAEDLYAKLSESLGVSEAVAEFLNNAVIDSHTVPLKDETVKADCFNYYEGHPEDEKTYKIAGFIPEEDANCIVLSESDINALGINPVSGDCPFSLSALPKDSDLLKEMVTESYNDDADYRNTVNNSATYNINNFNFIFRELAVLFFYVAVALAIFAGVLLMSYISNSITSKKHEIGVLRAVGARGSDIFNIFFNESFIIALINFIITCTGTFLIVSYINSYFTEQYMIPISILPFGIKQIVLVLVISVGVAFVSSLVPVTNISRKKPIDAIKNN